MSYCETTDVGSLFGDTSDEPTTEMLNTAVSNADAWIEINLKKHYIPLPDSEEIPPELKTAAIYYAASDVLIPLYHGDDFPTQYDIWFNKAQQFLNDYIEAYNNSVADESDLMAHQSVKHSHSLTYNQKRRLRRWGR